MHRKVSRFSRRGVAVAVLAIAIGAFLSIGASRVNATTHYRVALVIPDFTQNELILDLKNGAQAAAKKYGVTLTVTGAGAAEDQVKAIKDAIAAHVNAIDYDTTDAAALTPV